MVLNRLLSNLLFLDRIIKVTSKFKGLKFDIY